ncbi:MAG: TetR/AcrR family transcriptional regulator [Gammaproteobacteria bacterium]|nr:TetR/AcrR family transcriptional regulator [Gammaproteobacteria bacterium]
MAKKSRQERKKADMQLHLMQYAMKLFRTKGFDDTTMGEIASTADVTKRTLYHHFPMKEALVSAYWLNNIHLHQNQLPLLLENFPDTRSRLLAVFLSAAEGFKSETEFARIHFSYQFQKIGKNSKPQIPDDFVIFLTAVIEAGQHERNLRNDVTATELATQIMLNFTAICLMWFVDPDSFSLDKKLTNAVNCFIDGAGII